MALILAEYWKNNADSSSLDMVWDAFKAFVRGQYISAIAAKEAEGYKGR